MPVKIVIKKSKYEGFLIKTIKLLFGIFLQSFFLMICLKFFKEIGLYLGIVLSIVLDILAIKFLYKKETLRLTIIGMTATTVFLIITYLALLYFLHNNLNI